MGYDITVENLDQEMIQEAGFVSASYNFGGVLHWATGKGFRDLDGEPCYAVEAVMERVLFEMQEHPRTAGRYVRDPSTCHGALEVFSEVRDLCRAHPRAFVGVA